MTEQLTLAGIVRPVVLAVGGCSGSGKTMLARELAQQLRATLFPLDFYYRDLAHLSFEQRNSYNFDHPDSLEHDLIVEHVQALRDGKAIDRPNYDFSTHSRVAGVTDHVSAEQFVIVEGILALHYQDLAPLCDLSVYVDTPHDVCLMRRIHRDVRERGRTEESVRTQFETFARPMADEYVLPGKTRADVIVSGTEALDWSVEQVLSTLRERELLRSDRMSGGDA
jgi:uridine kinase